ncbi:MAG TPA: glucose-6-phosphate dehydrogenase [Fimbriimonadaceae bacterium]|jgi:glucose-6-phosphate 1-dehydrogenase
MPVNGNNNPVIITIFGIKGDLAMRKLIPALFNLFLDKSMPQKFQIIGVGRECTEEYMRTEMRPRVDEFSRRGKTSDADWNRFAPNLESVDGVFEDPGTYQKIADTIAKQEKAWGDKANHIFYLSVPPTIVEMIVSDLGKAHLSRDKKRERIVVEKPFGRDYASAEELNKNITQWFQESQIFRIDHFLGKETVQNLLAFRFANALYEPLWNRRYIDHVQFTVGETVGVEARGGFYETAGAMRDMIQNHMLQVMCLIAMEPPVSFDADEIRNKKVDVLKAIRPMDGPDLYKRAVRGQYGAGWMDGSRVPGYRQEQDVAPDSNTETFAAFKFFVDNWRWQDVPFYLRTGKRLPQKVSQVSIEFKPVPHQIFPSAAVEHWEPNRLIINIQPKEGIQLRFQAKEPGKAIRLRTVSMDFFYEDCFKVQPPEAYETLLYDVMIGDTTPFMRIDQALQAWQLLAPVLETWENVPSADFPNYAAGSWGPEAAEALIARDGRSWFSMMPSASEVPVS